MEKNKMKQELIEVKRFDLKVEPKVIRALAKFFDQADKPISEEKAIERRDLFKLDTANVCMIEPLSQESKRVLSRFVENEEESRILPKLDYSDQYGTGSKYSADYMKKIMDLFYASGDGVKVFVCKDYPATFENEHFRIVLAPRVGGD